MGCIQLEIHTVLWKPVCDTGSQILWGKFWECLFVGISDFPSLFYKNGAMLVLRQLQEVVI